MDKKDRLKELILSLHKDSGDDNVERVKNQFKEEFGAVTSFQISKMEQELLQEGLKVEDIQSLCNIHADVFEGSIEDIHSLDQLEAKPGHPLLVFRKENQGLIEKIEGDLAKSFKEYESDFSEDNRLNLIASVKELSKIIRHYERKEILFFPFLEKKGITGPSKVMWGKDDEIRDIFKLVLNGNLEKEVLLNEVNRLKKELISMVTKENDILSPMLMENIDGSSWRLIGQASATIGYAFNGGIEGASPSDAQAWLEGEVLEGTAEGEIDGEEISKDGFIKFPSGNINMRDLTLMLNTSPVDFTYIDKDDKVVYFSEGKDPVFARTRTIIGRDVRNCHPPRAQEVLNQLLADFKSGFKDEEIRTVKMGTKVLLIRYYAVRDEEGAYVGTLEVTEEISKYKEYLK